MNGISHIFFDLDNTLWDFSRNSKKILYRIYQDFKLEEKGIAGFEAFHTQYAFRNDSLWQAYKAGTKTAEEVRLQRFRQTLYDHGIDSGLMAHQMADYYINNTKQVKDLLPGALDLLEALKGKYLLHIITNGFDEVQFFKIRNAGIDHYFKTITTAEQAGVLKPHPYIFEYALQKAGAETSNSVYIGDSPEADGKGAEEAGIPFIWFNYHGRSDEHTFPHEVEELTEITSLLEQV